MDKASSVSRRIVLPFAVLLLLALFLQQGECRGFARVSGNRFVTDGNRPLYLNGFNAYWMMQLGSNQYEKDKVTRALQQASRYGMNVARTWAFSDGGPNPLQITPGAYDENMFKVVSISITFQISNCIQL